MHSQFEGTGVALITPFNDDLSIDLKSYGDIIEHVISENIDFLVPLGSTGETATLNEEEARKILDFAIEVNAGRKPILAGNFGASNTREIVRKLKDCLLYTSPSPRDRG